MEKKFIELDVSKIVKVPSDTEIPVYDNYRPTERALCTEFPQNKEILTKLEAVFNPEHVTECTSDLFNGDYETIVKIEDLKKALSELLIRFDTNPKNYTKKDYSYLMGLLYKTLLYIYKNHPLSVITNEWLDPHSDKKVPSEKLVKETIDAESERIEGLISDETSARQSADSDLQDNIDSEAGTRATEITRVEGLISAEELARQQADTNLQNTKQDNLTAGENISIENNVISAIDTIYDDTQIKSDIADLQLNKLDNLTPGDNISITNNVISAVDTIYDDTEVRGLISAVDLKVDDLGDFECGEIVATTTNFVEGTEYTVHEALQRTANLFEGYQGYIDDINELIPNQATSSNQLADKAFVNSTVATNAANFRGNWADWNSVPTNSLSYPEDYSGNRVPTNNDYLVITDASGYISNGDEITIQFYDIRDVYYGIGCIGNVKIINTTIGVILLDRGSNDFNKLLSGKLTDEIWYKINFGNNVKLSLYSDSSLSIPLELFINGTYQSSITVRSNSIFNSYLPSDIIYDGSWRFLYQGDWDTLGKSGWKPLYQIGSAFTAAQQAAIDSGVTSTKVSTYDGYATTIGALQTDKVDKVYTANKIYGTNNQGTQTAYTAGTGISFENGQINSTIQEDLLPLIYAGL